MTRFMIGFTVSLDNEPLFGCMTSITMCISLVHVHTQYTSETLLLEHKYLFEGNLKLNVPCCPQLETHPQLRRRIAATQAFETKQEQRQSKLNIASSIGNSTLLVSWHGVSRAGQVDDGDTHHQALAQLSLHSLKGLSS